MLSNPASSDAVVDHLPIKNTPDGEHTASVILAGLPQDAVKRSVYITTRIRRLGQHQVKALTESLRTTSATVSEAATPTRSTALALDATQASDAVATLESYRETLADLLGASSDIDVRVAALGRMSELNDALAAAVPLGGKAYA